MIKFSHKKVTRKLQNSILMYKVKLSAIFSLDSLSLDREARSTGVYENESSYVLSFFTLPLSRSARPKVIVGFPARNCFTRSNKSLEGQ